MSTLQVNRIVPLTGDSVYIQGAVIDSASFAATASYVANAVSSSYAATSSYASTAGFNFQQSSPSNTWTINHNLNNPYPLVQVYDSSNVVLIPQSISSSNSNTTVISFSYVASGYARVV